MGLAVFIKAHRALVWRLLKSAGHAPALHLISIYNTIIPKGPRIVNNSHSASGFNERINEELEGLKKPLVASKCSGH